MDRFVIKDESYKKGEPVYIATNIHVNLQSKFTIIREPTNEVVVYPWRRWYKSDHNIN